MVANPPPAPPLSPDELGRRLAEVYAVVGPLYRRAARYVEQRAPIEGLSVGVRAVMELLLAAGPLTVPQIARALALSRQFVQRMANDATARGLIEVTANPAHRRSSLLVLTERGNAAIAEVKEREHTSLGEVGGDLTGADIDACLRVLRQMLAYVDQVDP